MIKPTDQTEFAFEEPLYEGPRLTVEEEKKQAELKAIPWYKRKKNIVMLVTGILVLVIVILLMLPKRPLTVVQPTASPTPVPTVIDNSSLRGRINVLKQELEEAETNQQALPFPAVDMEINL